MPRKYLFLFSLPLLLIGLATGAMALTQEPLASQETLQVSSTAPSALTPAVPVPVAPPLPLQKSPDTTRAWVPGMLYRYTLTSTQEVSSVQPQPGAQPPPGMRFHLRGEWRVGIVSVEGEQVHARVQLVPSAAEVSLGGEGVLAPEVRRTFEAGLTQPFFLTLNRSGAVQLAHFDPDTDLLVQGLLRATVAATQHVWAGPSQITWQTEEMDSTGRYSARYTRKSASRFEKSKLAYSHLATPEGLQPLEDSPRVSVSALTTFELGEDLWARTLQGREHLEVDSGPSMFKAISTLQVGLELQERRQDSSLLGALDARRGQLVTSPLASYQGQEQDPRIALRQVLAGKTFDELVKGLHALPTNEQERDSAKTQALEQLNALFLLEPRQALLVHAALSAGMEPGAASPLLGALSAASTPECLQALSRIAGDEALPGPMRVDAIAALGMASTPNEEGVTALRKLSHGADAELADTATLGLGNAAMKLGQGQPRDAEPLVHELSSAYRSTSQPEQQALMLRALGNTRSPSALPTLQSALSSSSPEVRAAAVEALRGMPAPGADQLLSSILLQDATAEVRQSAVFASSFRPLAPLLPALAQALRLDPSELVRREIITLAGGQLPAAPEARALLEWSSQNEPNPSLRNTALTFLSARTP
ncbi:HEAT repeat domain-containing protein [Stigmatella sp. ncwal1]|uniref:HEAT repeat domain-containing protein n=1 Tax=Stigmatella ashevillensis TaxID=2995309 RepID=A0ABT5DHN3_9BACT|nr:HEAT repeat domain-containing protein [Stigmatella ashevillena]MDC0713171.1 HEAT repeat domain-containing protein [Stigmatella ashevillena]